MQSLLHLPSSSSPPQLLHRNLNDSKCVKTTALSRREYVALQTTSSLVGLISLSALSCQFASAEPSSKSVLSGIANTKAWFQFFGDGFSIRVPPQFQDVMEPEDYNAGLSLYGDKAKPKTFAARFASPDGAEILSVVIRPTNQMKITFLEAKDISDLGSLRTAAKLFVPATAELYSARVIKIKEDEGYKTYYFYEFGRNEERIALVAAVNGGRAFIAGAAAPLSKWGDDGIMLRSAAISMTLL